MIELNERQEKILDIVKKHGPITGESIADLLEVTRAALRPDLAVLTMSGYLEAKPRVGYTYKSEGIGSRISKVLNQYRVLDNSAQYPKYEELLSKSILIIPAVRVRSP